ncbi:MAG: hypothetical protein QM736_27735 [Vicinamibacterales bacterium]
MLRTRRAFLWQALSAAAWYVEGRRIDAQEPRRGVSPLGLDADRDGLLYLPAGYRHGTPTALLVLCHGAGSTAQSVSYAFPMADRHGVIILAPDSRDQRTWDLVLGSYGADADFLARALGLAMQRCSVDRSRLVVGGHSDGASFALSFGIGAGDVFSRIVAFSAGVLRPVDARGKPAIFISHGIDDPVMPIDDTARRFVPRLRGLGYDVTYREDQGRHAVPAEIVEEGFSWIRSLMS